MNGRGMFALLKIDYSILRKAILAVFIFFISINITAKANTDATPSQRRITVSDETPVTLAPNPAKIIVIKTDFNFFSGLGTAIRGIGRIITLGKDFSPHDTAIDKVIVVTKNGVFKKEKRWVANVEMKNDKANDLSDGKISVILPSKVKSVKDIDGDFHGVEINDEKSMGLAGIEWLEKNVQFKEENLNAQEFLETAKTRLKKSPESPRVATTKEKAEKEAKPPFWIQIDSPKHRIEILPEKKAEDKTAFPPKKTTKETQEEIKKGQRLIIFEFLYDCEMIEHARHLRFQNGKLVVNTEEITQCVKRNLSTEEAVEKTLDFAEFLVRTIQKGMEEGKINKDSPTTDTIKLLNLIREKLPKEKDGKTAVKKTVEEFK